MKRPPAPPNKEADTLGRITLWVLTICIILCLLGITAVILTLCYRFVFALSI